MEVADIYSRSFNKRTEMIMPLYAHKPNLAIKRTKMKRLSKSIWIIVYLCITVASAEWLQWRGENRDGILTQFSDAFYIDKYEVTVAQYKQFISSTGHPEPIKRWDDPQYNQPNYPVIGVTWYDAMAYAEWAGKMSISLTIGSLVPSSNPLRLP